MNESLPPHLAALAVIGDELRAATPLPEAFAEISRLMADQVQVELDGTVTIRDAAGILALDPADDWHPMTPSGWVANLRSTRRDLFERDAKPAHQSDALPTKTPVEGESFTAMNARAKAGDASARALIDADLRRRAGLPAEPAPNLSRTMAAAKAGDRAAIQRLQALLSR